MRFTQLNITPKAPSKASTDIRTPRLKNTKLLTPPQVILDSSYVTTKVMPIQQCHGPDLGKLSAGNNGNQKKHREFFENAHSFSKILLKSIFDRLFSINPKVESRCI